MNVHFSNPGLSHEGLRSAHDGRTGDPPIPSARVHGKLALPWSLLALGVGYFLMVLGPLWSSRFSAGAFIADSGTDGAWLPAPAAAGLALLGAAALIFVIARLVRDVEQQPYASIAPVLAVFSGFILTSTRAELGLPGLGSSQLGLVALTLALLGGVLIGRDSLSERALGWVLATMPTLALVLMISALHGERNPIKMFQRVPAALCTYLLLLIVSCLAMAAVGTVARRLLRAAAHNAKYASPAISMPRVDHAGEPLAQRAARAVAQHVAYNERQHATSGGQAWQQSARSNAGHAVRTMPGYPVGQPARAYAPRQVGPTGHAAFQPTLSMSELALDDPDLLKLTGRKFPLVRIALLAAVGVGLGLAAVYFFPLSRPGEAAPQSPAPSKGEATRAPTADTRAPAMQGASTTPGLAAPHVDALPSAQPVTPPSAGASLSPVVTPLTTTSTAPVPSIQAEPPAPRVQRREHHRQSSARAPEAKPERVSVEADKPAPKAARATPEKKVVSEPAAKPVPSKPTAPAKATAAPAKSQNSEDLDLDDLVQKALQGGHGNASDDPILGL
ncbi:MAG: hypothetical protein RLZZ450_7528 [Pseudomonadota bacterium]|jgi:hypothetical protein